MEALYTDNQNIFKENIKQMEDSNEVKSILILLTNDKTFSVEFLNPLLKSFLKPIIGGVFYEVIYNSEQKNKGVLLIPLSFELKTEIFNFNSNCIDGIKFLSFCAGPQFVCSKALLNHRFHQAQQNL